MFLESGYNIKSSTTPLRTAVLFLVFNRPEVTAQVFEAIRQARPPRLYVAADGSRSNRPDEAELCSEVRRIATNVDWPCEVKTLFRENNLGCKVGVSSGISWFFDNEEEGIIIEDDCLPSQSFFVFCEALLEKYRHDERVWQICGSAFVAELTSLERDTSYLFSKYGPIWGWASWQRAWKHYDPELSNWPQMLQPHWINSAYGDTNEIKARLVLGKKLYRNEIDTWDYQWGFVKNYQNALSIVPTRNLVVNIGFGLDATHTTTGNTPLTAKSEIKFPLQHPPFILADTQHDQLYRKTNGISSNSGSVHKLARLIKHLLKKIFHCSTFTQG